MRCYVWGGSSLLHLGAACPTRPSPPPPLPFPHLPSQPSTLPFPSSAQALNVGGAGPAVFGSACFVTIMKNREVMEIWGSMYDVSPVDRLPSPSLRAGLVVEAVPPEIIEYAVETALDLLGKHPDSAALQQHVWPPMWWCSP